MIAINATFTSLGFIVQVAVINTLMNWNHHYWTYRWAKTILIHISYTQNDCSSCPIVENLKTLTFTSLICVHWKYWLFCPAYSVLVLACPNKTVQTSKCLHVFGFVDWNQAEVGLSITLAFFSVIQVDLWDFLLESTAGCSWTIIACAVNEFGEGGITLNACGTVLVTKTADNIVIALILVDMVWGITSGAYAEGELNTAIGGMEEGDEEG